MKKFVFLVFLLICFNQMWNGADVPIKEINDPLRVGIIWATSALFGCSWFIMNEFNK